MASLRFGWGEQARARRARKTRRCAPTANSGAAATWRWLAMLLAAAILGGPAARAAHAQGIGMDRTIPPLGYYNAFNLLYDGDYDLALKAFEADSRNSIKTSQSRWIDSICYEAMCGECLFQMGRLRESLDHYTAALSVFKTFPDWMSRLLSSGWTIRPGGAGSRKLVPWGVSKRQAPVGTYQRSVLLIQGQIDMTNVVMQGGVVQQANGFPVTPQEIVRCTALALRRRATLLGPASKYDPLNNDVIAAMNQAVGPPNHWSDSWVCLERGLALVAGGKESQAVTQLQRAVLAGGEFDHPMTCVALLELGRQALAHSEYPKAAECFEEATYAAVNNYGTGSIPDYGVLEEAFRGGMLTHLLTNGKGMFPPLEAALQWSKVNKLRQFHASLLLLAAENYAILGETRPAVAMLDEARATIGKRVMAAGSLGARLTFLTALVAYQQKRIPEGNTALAAAMAYMQHGSLWLFHIGLVDELYHSGGVTPRAALDLFKEVLRDPQPADWATDPMESLAVLVTPHLEKYEHWFDTALARSAGNEIQLAIEISERARRHRFFTSLELGGRLESLRWLLEAAPAYLSQQALLQRQDLLARYPAYQRLSQQAQAIHAALVKLPLVPDDQAVVREQSRQLAELATVSAQQEAILREMAVRREPAGLIFPPLRSVPEVQKTLPPKHAALAFFATEKQLYGFLMDKDRCAPPWRINAPAAVLKQMQTMLREMGMFQQNHELTVKELADAKWKQSAKQLLDMLLKGSPADFSQPFEELVIVPDGALWYLPFEALQVIVDKQPQSLISRFRIRYAPTLSLTSFQGPGRGPMGNTAVVLGKLSSRDDDKVMRAAFDELAAAVPGAVALRSPPPAPSSVYGTLFQRLIVLDDIVPSEQDPYGWTPAPIDRNKSGGLLSDWIALPWGGPDVILLPGFHTAAEDAMKRAHRGPPGNEMFLSVCGLMASGARTVLLSRWRVGGQTSFDLTREFAQELPRQSPASAWQRAVMLERDSRLNLEAEPRIKHGANEEAPKGDHPFFWAGYMLVDCGTAPESAEPKADEPNPDVKKPEAAAEKRKPPAPQNPPAGK